MIELQADVDRARQLARRQVGADEALGPAARTRSTWRLLLPGTLLVLAACALSPATPSSSVVAPLPPEPRPIYVAPSGPVADPALTIAEDGTLYVAWWGRGFGEIFVSRSTDQGDTWSEPVNASNTPLGSDFPVLATAPGRTVYLAWEDFSVMPTGGEIMFSVSHDGGASWAPMQNVSNTKTASSRPALLAEAPGVLALAWIEGEGEVRFVRSTDGGQSWSSPVSISGSRGAVRSRSPVLALADGRLWSAWADPAGVPVLTESRDQGTTWSDPVALTPLDHALTPWLAVAPDGSLYAAWSQGNGLYSDVVFLRSIDAEPVNVSRSPTVSSVDPVIAVDRRGTILCVWHEVVAGDTEIFMARSADGGRTFSVPVNVSRTPGNSLAPRVTADHAGASYVVWEQGVKQAIYFLRLD